ncbi:MAG TPA: antibiotic biosynthesis monooxygenase, partial [Sphingomicrobium sp.]|nr:antibiotic biosynthesis monooxygenase [Sphingomicrobium sp.]
HRVWKFRPPQGREAEFAEAYGEAGDWAQLFRNAPGYGGTMLLHPAEPGDWWLTVDRWETAADFDAFATVFGERYRTLDEKLEGVAGEEVFVGAFES